MQIVVPLMPLSRNFCGLYDPGSAAARRNENCNDVGDINDLNDSLTSKDSKDKEVLSCAPALSPAGLPC